MKRFGTILLLLLILQYTFGLFTVYMWNSILIMQSMKAAIAAGSFQPNQVTTITVALQKSSQADIKRCQQDEISIDGKMYDVVSAQQANGKLTLKCIFDEDENRLIASYQQALESGRNHSSEKSIIPLKNVFSPFVVNNPVICFSHIEVDHPTQLSPYSTVNIEPLFRGVPTPPPWQV